LAVGEATESTFSRSHLYSLELLPAHTHAAQSRLRANPAAVRHESVEYTPPHAMSIVQEPNDVLFGIILFH